ncbi:ABC transporter permease subunit [Campylobacter canadensis]|uniref:ABC transporter permease subunit n=1 Tax=Campylobacter canadensis TaxID=449520 RepID=A0ABS7WSQ8_9BACT|nr:ABC transporter permease subunit [Campylobacter canadensis]MBZ7987337.1 ABC transporter permease subunit [Campylobacter canadensis]MBZ7994780.1 ABC transporter permease subunit [Campylobacter canadensis]MBZ7996512.1 ABC transporter permease subunit [Campylobacter canadensis]MBZ7998492.1 ABC transporter permease subunit [Campylobacter canadensis]MBZ8000206.1 ABC transporter permease subunit [Campylobacter canadensis]
MAKFIIKRILYAILCLFLASIFIFLLLRLNGTDAVLNYLYVSGIAPTDEAINNARIMLGLNESIYSQYIKWISGALRFDFGYSYFTNRAIGPDLFEYLINTLKLTSFAFLLTLAISFPFGILSAIYKNRFFDYFVRAFSFLGVSTPNFWLGLLFILFFSVKLGWLPPFGIGGFSHIIMPALAISFMSIAINARFIRVNFLESSNERYITYAKMRRVSKSKIYIKHILTNSLLPLITAFGMHIGELFGGALVIENIFAYPGVGRYAVGAIYNSDYPVIQAFILMMCFVFILINLITDIVYVIIDPRIKYE